MTCDVSTPAGSLSLYPYANESQWDEMYFGNGDAVVIDLAAARVRARQERMKANRMATCGICVGGHDFGALQLQRAECRMS